MPWGVEFYFLCSFPIFILGYRSVPVAFLSYCKLFVIIFSKGSVFVVVVYFFCVSSIVLVPYCMFYFPSQIVVDIQSKILFATSW